MFLRKLLLISLLVIFSFSVCGYGVYKALPVILGPKIDINYPNNGEETDKNTIEVRGNVYRAKTLYINNIPTGFSESGYFSTQIPIYNGSNLIIIEASDRFGRKTTLTRNVGASDDVEKNIFATTTKKIIRKNPATTTDSTTTTN